MTKCRCGARAAELVPDRERRADRAAGVAGRGLDIDVLNGVRSNILPLATELWRSRRRARALGPVALVQRAAQSEESFS